MLRDKRLAFIRTVGSLSIAAYLVYTAALVASNAGSVGDWIEDGHVSSDPNRSLSTLFAPTSDWPLEQLDAIRSYSAEIGSHSLVIVHRGRLVAEWGDTTARISGASIRKSLLSSLYGVAVGRGLIEPASTLAELGIEGTPTRLSATEQSATITQLLQARSGVYLPGADAGEQLQRIRPPRGSHAPGTFWFYNHWDFNALGAIFEQETRLPIGEAFEQWIADPIGMQDFRAEDVTYTFSAESDHPSYRFRISARDLARFGVLYLNEGGWRGRQVIPSPWVRESTRHYSETYSGGYGGRDGYGYLWWVEDSGSYYASGARGQRLFVDPLNQLVIVHRVNTGANRLERLLYEYLGDRVSQREIRQLKELIDVSAPGEEDDGN